MKAFFERLTNWIHFRRERRIRANRAAYHANLMVCGGTIDIPRRSK